MFLQKKLNGKPLLLTCKKCNNINGSTYDSQLAKWFKAHCALEGKGDLDLRMAINSSRTFKVKLTKKNEIININFNKKNPYAEKNISEINKMGKVDAKFVFDFGNQKKIDDGFLRFAYLYAFYYFGYSYIFSPSGKYINDYLSFKKNSELKPLVVSANLDIYEQGIYKISSPTYITSFLVVFSFGSDIKKNIGIIIPGPKEEHLNNFKLLSKEKFRN